MPSKTAVCMVITNVPPDVSYSSNEDASKVHDTNIASAEAVFTNLIPVSSQTSGISAKRSLNASIKYTRADVWLVWKCSLKLIIKQHQVISSCLNTYEMHCKFVFLIIISYCLSDELLAKPSIKNSACSNKCHPSC